MHLIVVMLSGLRARTTTGASRSVSRSMAAP